MASGSHMLVQQKGSVEARVKTLVNSDLKEICKAYNYAVSGTKAVLQKRCIDILNETVKRGDVRAFELYSYRINNRGRAPPPDCSLAAQSHNTNSSTHTMGPRPVAAQARLPPGGRYFKDSPFYKIEGTVLPLKELPVGEEMPQNRHTVRHELTLDETTVTNIRTHKMRLLLYCGQSAQMSPATKVDIAFPNQIEVKINNDLQAHNFKGLKNKPGTTKPADITELVHVRNNYHNTFTVTYALTTKKYALVIHLASVVTPDALTEQVKAAMIIPKDQVLLAMKQANDDPDIAATSIRMSLKDPISTMRISLPVRSSYCSHNQCFDAGMFMQMMAQAPTWACPICSRTISFDSLCVDKYFQDILDRTPRSIDKVVIEPNGEWTIIKEEEDALPNGSSSKPRASYDDDFDDDLVEVVDPPVKARNGARPSLPLPNGLQSYSMNTPPLSSRETSVAQSTTSHQMQRNKRPAESVIDLTLDESDEEQPPRPAKRQTIHGVNGSRPSPQPAAVAPASVPRATSFSDSGGSFGTSLSVLPQSARLTSVPSDRSSPFLTANNSSGPHSPVQPPNHPGPFGVARNPQQHSRPPSQHSLQQGFGGGSFSMRPPTSGPSTGPAAQRSGLQLHPLPASDQGFRLAPMRGEWRSDHSNSSSPPT